MTLSIEQLCRDLLEQAIRAGLVRLASPDDFEDPDPQVRSAGELTGVANMINAFIAESQGAQPAPGGRRRAATRRVSSTSRRILFARAVDPNWRPRVGEWVIVRAMKDCVSSSTSCGRVLYLVEPGLAVIEMSYRGKRSRVSVGLEDLRPSKRVPGWGAA